MDINIFEKLINEFSKVPKLEAKAPTYLEISGQPHFENVCSNILAFYFNTNASHGFKDLVLRSFIECFDESLLVEYDIETINIEREFYVEEQKRIDIVIECNDLVITIENKIYHILNNELNLYEKSIESRYPNKKHKFIVLSLKEENTESTSFVAVTYEKFFYRLKQNLGWYFVNSNNQYTTFLIDFIQTIENLTKVEKHNQKYIEFYFKNRNEVESLVKEHDDLKKALHSKVNYLYDSISIAENSRIIKKWIWQKNTIVFEFDFGDKKVWLPFVIDFNKIIGLIYVKKDKNNLNENDELLSKLVLLDKYEVLKYNKEGRLIIFERDILFTEINIETIANEIIQIISMIKAK